MHKVLKMADFMDDELKDAKKYVEAASRCKDTNRELHDTYLTIARDRVATFKRLEQSCSRMFDEKLRRSREMGQNTQHIEDVHEWCNAKFMERENEVQRMLEKAAN